MEDLETQKNLLNLGKKLVDNFKGDESEQISKWMTYYIAEKITAIDSARGKAKVSAKKECFEAILVLWKHQAYFPQGTKPFENFEAVFSALAHIDPDKNSSSFFRNENDNQKIPKEVKQYIDLIINLDAATRLMISFFVREAMLNSVDESTILWLDAIKEVDKSEEAQVILKFLPELDIDDVDEAQANKEQRIKELSEHIDRLNVFENTSQYIKSTLKAQLDDLEPNK